LAPFSAAFFAILSPCIDPAWADPLKLRVTRADAASGWHAPQAGRDALRLLLHVLND
jgi:hypothetical protein